MKLTISTAVSRESLDWTPRDYTWAALVDRLRTLHSLEHGKNLGPVKRRARHEKGF